MPRAALLHALLLALLSGGCKSCLAEPPKLGAGIVDGGTLLAEDSLPFRAPISQWAGTLDVRNRYASTVVVETRPPRQGGVDGLCSGILIGPRVVLTAGHCVCTRQRAPLPEAEGQSTLNGSTCETQPTVEIVVYDPPRQGLERMPGYTSRAYEGIEVRPHPEFKLLLDGQDRTKASRADLALILLNAPVEEALSPMPLADTDVQAGEPFLMAGYTYDKIVGGVSGQRRFTQYKVETLMPPGDDRALFKQPGRELFTGDSGGPCLREAPSGAVLVGISSRGFGDRPTFTRTYPYRDWVASELERAARLFPPMPQGHQAPASSGHGGPAP